MTGPTLSFIAQLDCTFAGGGGGGPTTTGGPFEGGGQAVRSSTAAVPAPAKITLRMFCSDPRTSWW